MFHLSVSLTRNGHLNISVLLLSLLPSLVSVSLSLTPAFLLSSEHIDKLISDPKNPPSAARASELLAIRSQAGAMGKDELQKAFTDLAIVSPSSGTALSAPFPFNLMFETQIGPTGKFVGYLRPETAQGIFVNYRKLLESNNGRVTSLSLHPPPCLYLSSASHFPQSSCSLLIRCHSPVLRSVSHSEMRLRLDRVCCECVNSLWRRSNISFSQTRSNIQGFRSSREPHYTSTHTTPTQP